MLYTFIRHGTQGHRHHHVIYIYIILSSCADSMDPLDTCHPPLSATALDFLLNGIQCAGEAGTKSLATFSCGFTHSVGQLAKNSSALC